MGVAKGGKLDSGVSMYYMMRKEMSTLWTMQVSYAFHLDLNNLLLRKTRRKMTKIQKTEKVLC